MKVSEALDELKRQATEAAQIVKLRYFADLTDESVVARQPSVAYKTQMT